MFKRMSVLVRRDGDTRDYFSAKWKGHAAPVASLPRVRGYIQNHIEQEFPVPGKQAPIRADGFVELYWDKPEDMAEAFKSPLAKPMIDDEPNFLGHGSGYALAAAPSLQDSEGGKLILALVYEEACTLFDELDDEIAALPVLHFIRDDVVKLIDKPYMTPSQPVTSFIHLYFDGSENTRKAGEQLASFFAGKDQVRAGIYGVYTVRFV